MHKITRVVESGRVVLFFYTAVDLGLGESEFKFSLSPH